MKKFEENTKEEELVFFSLFFFFCFFQALRLFLLSIRKLCIEIVCFFRMFLSRREISQSLFSSLFSSVEL